MSSLDVSRAAYASTPDTHKADVALASPPTTSVPHVSTSDAPVPVSAPALDEAAIATLEAFADTIVPGEKRSATDRAIAGATDGPGAVQAGALTLLLLPETGVAAALPQVVAGLNAYATGLAAGQGIRLDPEVAPFVALDFASRTAIVQQLTTPGQPGQGDWTTLALIVSLAFDDASFMPTAEAIRTGHPGVTTLGLPKPDSDGLWRFTEYSYGRQLAHPHPTTTPKGSPA